MTYKLYCGHISSELQIFSLCLQEDKDSIPDIHEVVHNHVQV